MPLLVFAQIWNSFNRGGLDRKPKVFAGMMKNWYFMFITSIGSSFLPEAAPFLISLYIGCLPGYLAYEVPTIGSSPLLLVSLHSHLAPSSVSSRTCEAMATS